MGKFDPIDIFFIALISTYFITLICIGITFLCIYFSKKKKAKTSEPVVVSLEEKEVSVTEEDKIEEKTKKQKVKKVALIGDMLPRRLGLHGAFGTQHADR